MNRKIKNPDNYKSTIRFLALMAALIGTATAFIGEFALPAASAFLAALMLFEEKRIASSLVSALIIVVNLTFDLLLGGRVSPMGIETVLLAIVIFFMFTKHRSKAECVIAVTVIVSLLTFLSFVLEACFALGDFSWDAVVKYYGDFYLQVKDLLVEQTEKMMSLMKTRGDVVDVSAEELVVTLLDSIVMMLPSLIIVAAFVIGGAALKLFHALVFKYIEDRTAIISWRFKSTSVFAYFYFVLLITSFFANGTDVLAVTVMNLANIFMYVFAYLGIKYAFGILSGMRSRGFAIGMLAIAFAAMSSMAVTLLSALGAYFTIKENRYVDSRGNDTEA